MSRSKLHPCLEPEFSSDICHVREKREIRDDSSRKDDSCPTEHTVTIAMSSIKNFDPSKLKISIEKKTFTVNLEVIHNWHEFKEQIQSELLKKSEKKYEMKLIENESGNIEAQCGDLEDIILGYAHRKMMQLLDDTEDSDDNTKDRNLYDERNGYTFFEISYFS